MTGGAIIVIVKRVRVGACWSARTCQSRFASQQPGGEFCAAPMMSPCALKPVVLWPGREPVQAASSSDLVESPMMRTSVAALLVEHSPGVERNPIISTSCLR